MSRALGRYELLRPLARGGMGEVYLARRRAAGVEKWLVVKRMRPERAGDARFLELFMREARLSMSLAHQNIVPVFDFGRIDDQVFLAMERVEGRDLGSSLARAADAQRALAEGSSPEGTEPDPRRDHPIPPLVAAFIAAECCQALDYAHRRRGTDGSALGIVHRDVTPRNVLLSWSGEVKLTDFGIAALAGDEPTKTIGTPAYMAPEQARGEPCDARADVYAIGLVLREALTGVRSRSGNDREALVAAAKSGVLEPWPSTIESPLQAIVDRATAFDRADRYPDARSLLEALDQYIVGLRAATKGNSPARLLAAWLAEVWGDERDERDADGEIAADHMVSFLDDGEHDIVGTGTVRSMAMTAADDGPPTSASQPSSATGTSGVGRPTTAPGASSGLSSAAGVASSGVTSGATSDVRAGSVADASIIASASLTMQAQVPTAKVDALPLPARRKWIVGAAIAAIALLGAGAVAVVRHGGSSEDTTRVAGDPATALMPTAIVNPNHPSVDPSVNPTTNPSVNPTTNPTTNPTGPTISPTGPAHVDVAEPAVKAVGPRPRDGGHPPKPGPRLGPSIVKAVTDPAAIGRPHPSDAGSASAATVVKHKVVITTKPYWSNWTVDDDPTVHTSPERVMLAPGMHRIHFTGNPHFHADKAITLEVTDHDLQHLETLEETEH